MDVLRYEFGYEFPDYVFGRIGECMYYKGIQMVFRRCEFCELWKVAKWIENSLFKNVKCKQAIPLTLCEFEAVRRTWTIYGTHSMFAAL